jgi:hypothetical protein
MSGASVRNVLDVMGFVKPRRREDGRLLGDDDAGAAFFLGPEQGHVGSLDDRHSGGAVPASSSPSSRPSSRRRGLTKPMTSNTLRTDAPLIGIHSGEQD